MTGLVHLRAGGVSLLLDVSVDSVPAVLHWGADLGDDLPAMEAWTPPVPNSAVDTPGRATLLGEPSPQLGQEMRWVARGELRTLELPAADQGLVDLLSQ